MKLGPFVVEMENTCEEKRKFLKKFSEETLAVRAFSKQLKEKHNNIDTKFGFSCIPSVAYLNPLIIQ